MQAYEERFLPINKRYFVLNQIAMHRKLLRRIVTGSMFFVKKDKDEIFCRGIGVIPLIEINYCLDLIKAGDFADFDQIDLSEFVIPDKFVAYHIQSDSYRLALKLITEVIGRKSFVEASLKTLTEINRALCKITIPILQAQVDLVDEESDQNDEFIVAMEVA